MTVSDFTSSLRELLNELESSHDDQLNPNDVSHAADVLGNIADSLEYFDQNRVSDVESEARDLAYQIRELRDTIESWIR